MLWRLRACSLVQIAGFGALYPIQAVWMNSHGLSKTHIGVLMAMSTAVQFIGGILIGRFADRSEHPQRIQMLSSVVFAGGLAVFAFADSFASFAVFMIARGIGVGTIFAVMPLLVTSVLGSKKAGSGYASYRVFGSFGWVTGTIVMSQITQDLRWLILAAACFTLLAPLPLTGFRGRPQAKRQTVPVWRVFHNPKLLPVYAGVFFMSLGVPAVFEFLPLYAKQAFDAPVRFLGVLSGINGAIAIFALPIVGMLIDRTGPKRWLVFALLAQPLRVYFSGSVTGDYVWLLAPQLLHILTWAGLEIAGVLYVAKHTMPGNRAMATAAFYGAQVVGQFIGALLCGYLADAYGFRLMFTVIAAISALGPVAYLALSRRTGTNAQ